MDFFLLSASDSDESLYEEEEEEEEELSELSEDELLEEELSELSESESLSLSEPVIVDVSESESELLSVSDLVWKQIVSNLQYMFNLQSRNVFCKTRSENEWFCRVDNSSKKLPFRFLFLFFQGSRSSPKIKQLDNIIGRETDF